MSGDSRAEQVLQQLVKAARSAPDPVIDFEQLQTSVQAEWVARSTGRPRSMQHWRWLAAVAAAISFFVGGWYGHAQHQKSEAPVAERKITPQTLDGEALSLDKYLEALREPVTVNHPGVARWTLNAGGKARLVAKGPFLTVQLDAGRIDADVVPSAQSETFAVEAGALRVAVHGTTFSVIKTIDSLEVIVGSGAVIVGPSGSPGRTLGTVLRAPAQQKFTASVAAIAQSSVPREEPPNGASSAHGRSQVAPSGNATASNRAQGLSVPSAEASLEDQPSRVAVETALDTARAAVARCFAESKVSDPSRDDSHISVRVETRLTIILSPRGTLTEMTFAPPIPDGIVECARELISDFSGAPSRLGATANRQIMLTK